MGRLVEDLLALSRVSRAEVRAERVDLSEMARQIVPDLRQRDAARRIDLSIEDGVVVRGDPDLLRGVLDNLLGNAWKFTAKRPVAHLAFDVSTEEGRRWYRVRDDGAGFDPESAARLFQPFQRLHAASEFEGTGIGLATVRRIVERHRGRVRAEGRPGEGATFAFTLWDDGDPPAQ
jgi:signal transduction histidine kinase